MNHYRPGWRSPPDVLGPDESTGRNSVEGISLHSDIIENKLNYNMQSLTQTVYIEVHAQRPLVFIIVDVNFLYEE